MQVPSCELLLPRQEIFDARILRWIRPSAAAKNILVLLILVLLTNLQHPGTGEQGQNIGGVQRISVLGEVEFLVGNAFRQRAASIRNEKPEPLGG